MRQVYMIVFKKIRQPSYEANMEINKYQLKIIIRKNLHWVTQFIWRDDIFIDEEKIILMKLEVD